MEQEQRWLVVVHPSCPVQEAEARAAIDGAKLGGVMKVGPFDITTSVFVQPGRLIVIDSQRIRDGLTLPR